VSDEVVLSPVRPDDRAALVDHLQAREIWRNTLYIPHPYTEKEADAWIGERISHRREQTAEVTFAIRNPDGTLIGVWVPTTLTSAPPTGQTLATGWQSRTGDEGS
jgi:RimJ/RimL family protein N-acetyltransferase